MQSPYLPQSAAEKVHPEGSSLLYSTYLGGRQGDRGLAIAVDELGHAYIVGFTASPDSPTVDPLQADTSDH